MSLLFFINQLTNPDVNPLEAYLNMIKDSLSSASEDEIEILDDSFFQTVSQIRDTIIGCATRNRISLQIEDLRNLVDINEQKKVQVFMDSFQKTGSFEDLEKIHERIINLKNIDKIKVDSPWKNGGLIFDFMDDNFKMKHGFVLINEIRKKLGLTHMLSISRIDEIQFLVNQEKIDLHSFSLKLHHLSEKEISRIDFHDKFSIDSPLHQKAIRENEVNTFYLIRKELGLPTSKKQIEKDHVHSLKHVKIESANDNKAFISHNLKDGQIDGIYTEYWPGSDIIRLQGHFKEGKKHGHFVERNRKGIILSESDYLENEFDGYHLTYNDDGTLLSFTQYKKGVMHGIHRNYKKDDSVKVDLYEDGFYVNGKPIMSGTSFLLI
jgi:antitoxin component YwqK of YwqJK toxin-antitoxin module